MSGGGLVELVDREEALAMDEGLVRMARSQTVVRLAMGEAFVALGSGFQELGFSTFEAYVRERCVRSARWARDTRALARRLSVLPRIRERLAKGAIGWSLAELLARHATPDDEEELLEASAGMTVREVRRAMRERGEVPEPVEERIGTLEISADLDEAMMLTATLSMVAAIDGSRAPGEALAGILAEAQDSLTMIAPHADPIPEDVIARQKAWLASIQQGEELADRRAARVEKTLPPMPEVSVSPVDELPSGAVAIDRVLFRELAPRLASADVRFGELLARFFALRAWRVLGFVSEKQYAEERLGMSRSSTHARVTLWRRVKHLEKLGDALRDGAVGYEAACLIARVATPDTEEAWIARARKRTHKHLEEEVRAVEMIVQMMRLEDPPGPPEAHEVELAQAIHRDFVSGAYARRAFGIERDDDAGPTIDPSSSSPFAEMARVVTLVQEQLRTVIMAAREGMAELSPEEADAACTGLVEADAAGAVEPVRMPGHWLAANANAGPGPIWISGAAPDEVSAAIESARARTALAAAESIQTSGGAPTTVAAGESIQTSGRRSAAASIQTSGTPALAGESIQTSGSRSATAAPSDPARSFRSFATADAVASTGSVQTPGGAPTTAAAESIQTSGSRSHVGGPSNIVRSSRGSAASDAVAATGSVQTSGSASTTLAADEWIQTFGGAAAGDAAAAGDIIEEPGTGSTSLAAAAGELVRMSGSESGLALVESATCEPEETEKLAERIRESLRPAWPKVRMRIRAPEW